LRRTLDTIDRDALWLDYMLTFWGDSIDDAVEDLTVDDEIERMGEQSTLSMPSNRPICSRMFTS
jgi:hypothetical protein